MLLRNLGEVATQLIAAFREEQALHEDVDRFYGGGECHDAIQTGCSQRWIALVARLEAQTGYDAYQLRTQFTDRVKIRWLWDSGVLVPLEEVIYAREEEKRLRWNLQWQNRSRLPK